MGEMQVAGMPTTGNGNLPASFQLEAGISGQGVWGAAFHVGNRVFFVYNNAGGLYELDIGSIDFEQPKVGFKGSGLLKYAGLSAAVGSNDGMSCHNGGLPIAIAT